LDCRGERVPSVQFEQNLILYIQEGVCKKTINRNTSVESIAWCPSGDAFLSIEDSIVTKLVCPLDYFLTFDRPYQPPSIRTWQEK